ncbi:Mechanosensitive ion channel [Filimonas lacunae]|uniref:Mechanosensitive ion channel n=1 Tax=Filimonas lacunae TaxID=477680 RepID=A0A173MK99_9BACT|nr:mechanosensitive ion channel domain-containing protein [Filimonas lacunae]BAV08024.1 transport system permease protein [Filimonas lacunae]SIT08150.1 Mechanosensitive ion channel [Filimonas lacunae]
MWDQFEQSLDHLPDFLWNIILVGIGVLVGFIIKFLLTFLLRFYTKNTSYSIVASILRRLGKPVNYFLPLLAINALIPFMKLKARPEAQISRIAEILLTIAFAAILIGIIKVLEDYVYHRFDLAKPDNLRERKVRTQLQFVRKFAISLIIILTLCAILLSFESLRKLGTGLLTGVGVGGIIIGFAAQKSLGNLLAGFQIAFTQPIRIDDVLVVEGEWGKVEEITLTYVVLNIWDSRRLILPINYFIEKPFQNWTRTGSDLLGTAFFYLDHTAPIPEIRAELVRLLHASALWDKRVSVLQVTDIKERVIEVRALMSAQSSGIAFDLRCYIRENLMLFIQKNYPDCLPRTRAEIVQSPENKPPFTDAATVLM